MVKAKLSKWNLTESIFRNKRTLLDYSKFSKKICFPIILM